MVVVDAVSAVREKSMIWRFRARVSFALAGPAASWTRVSSSFTPQRTCLRPDLHLHLQFIGI
jgi:hypothetical protein